MAQAQTAPQHSRAVVDTPITNTAVSSYVAAPWSGAGLFAAGSVATAILQRSPVAAALKDGLGADPATE